MELKTDRLTIRPLREEDWADMREVFADFNASPYAAYDWPLPTGEHEARALVKQFAAQLFFTVRLSATGEMVGYVCFHPDGDRYDLGYCFHSAYQGRGYASEGITALLDHLARTHPVAAFTAGTALDNIPSRKLLERLGFRLVSTETVSFDGAFSFQGGNFERKPE